MLIKLYPDNPNPREVGRVAELLKNGGVAIYPTDGVYAFGCALSSRKGMERLKTICGKREDELSIICSGLSEVSEYARVDNAQFRIMKRNLPGPFTFILQASGRVPDKALGRRRNIGVRIPANNIPVAIAEAIGEPVVTASVKDADDVVEYTTDPELIHERYAHAVDVVIDGGYGLLVPTTVVDLTSGAPEVLREGAGELR